MRSHTGWWMQKIELPGNEMHGYQAAIQCFIRAVLSDNSAIIRTDIEP